MSVSAPRLTHICVGLPADSYLCQPDGWLIYLSKNMFEYDIPKSPQIQKLSEMVREWAVRAETWWKWSQIDIGSPWNTSWGHFPAYLIQKSQAQTSTNPIFEAHMSPKGHPSYYLLKGGLLAFRAPWGNIEI